MMPASHGFCPSSHLGLGSLSTTEFHVVNVRSPVPDRRHIASCGYCSEWLLVSKFGSLCQGAGEVGGLEAFRGDFEGSLERSGELGRVADSDAGAGFGDVEA